MDLTPNWSAPQRDRLAQWQCSRAVDVHCHCLPGLDDGPETMSDALRLCEALVADGLTTVVATPHQLGVYDSFNTAEVIRGAVRSMAEALSTAQIPLEVVPGADVRIDERLPRLLDADQVLTVGDLGRHILLELPHEMFVDPLPIFPSLHNRGLQVIMTHPERHRYLATAPERIESWCAAGALVQITAGSLLGDFGRLARDEAWRLIRAGLVSLVATDSHDARRRPPRMAAALNAVSAELGPEYARRICVDNPLRILQCEFVEPSRIA